MNNGKREEQLIAKEGNSVRVRLVNAAASSYFNVEYAGGPLTIVAADGVDVEPIQVQRLRIAIAETYDILVPVHQQKAYELRSSSEDGTGYASTFIGEGEKVNAPHIPKPNPLMTEHKNHVAHIKAPDTTMMQQHQHETGIIGHMTDYQSLRAIQDTSFSASTTRREVYLNLTGNMERYVWHFNNQTLLESDKIMIKQGEIVRVTLRNQTMMHHPIHLHGHFFRVINQHGDRSPLKHTVNVPPMDTVVIEFAATEEKDWFLHCHNLYHMKSGMARVFSYEGSTQATRETLAKIAHDTWYFRGDISALSNMSMGIFEFSNTRNAFELEFDSNYQKEYNAELIYKRNLSRYLNVYAGGNVDRKNKNSKSDTAAIVGVTYLLPMLIESNLRINSKAKVKLTLGSDLQLTERVIFAWSFSTHQEYQFKLAYELRKEILLATAYDSDFRWGVGVIGRL